MINLLSRAERVGPSAQPQSGPRDVPPTPPGEGKKIRLKARFRFQALNDRAVGTPSAEGKISEKRMLILNWLVQQRRRCPCFS